jgi:hypothetical protein
VEGGLLGREGVSLRLEEGVGYRVVWGGGREDWM